MTLSLDEEHHRRALKDGIPYTATVPITSVAAHVKVLVYDRATDLLGAADVRVK